MTFPKYLLQVLTLFALVSFVGCSTSSNDEPTSLMEAISELDEAQIFANWVADPANAADLNKPNQVIFVPTDQAIQSLLSAANLSELSDEAIFDLVSAHVSPFEQSISIGYTTEEIDGVTYTVNPDGSRTEGAPLEIKEIENVGVVVLMNRVLIPNRIRMPYISTNYEQNAADQIAIGDNLLSLASYFSSLRPTSSGVMRGSTTAEVQAVIAPLRDFTHPSFIDLVETYYTAQLVDAANGGDFHPDSSAAFNGLGGGFTRTGSKRYFYYKDGTEPQQIIEKGMYMATMYNQLLSELENVDATTADKVIALVGATPFFSNSASASQNPDRLGSNYFARRDKNESGVNGIYRALQYSITSLDIAIKLNDSEAINRLKNEVLLNYERGIIATVANYLHSTNAQISKTAPTDDDLSAAMHAYSEALGFMLGFVDLPTFADESELGTIWNHMLQPDNTTGEFNVSLIATDRFASVQKNNNALDAIQLLYGFSDQEMDDFRFNWVNEQGR